VRNWDYRYAWVRDAAYTVYAFRRVGLGKEAAGFAEWVIDAVERDGTARVMYTIDGLEPPAERSDTGLEGYRRSAPVRWGNAAARQWQHDAYGEILDCARQSARAGHPPGREWSTMARVVDAAAGRWREPDHGIWEVRTEGRVFTYSAAMCLVALDRGARLVEEFGLPGDAAAWRAEAARILDAIVNESWDPSRGTLREHLGSGGLDASLLALPLRRVLRADDPRMVATTRAIAQVLDAGGGLLYRYQPSVSPDGLPGNEGAFLLCSFWLVDNLTLQGRLDEAHELYERLCSLANGLGLLPEEVDPSDRSFLGNFPQGLSHVGVISSGIALARAVARPAGGRPLTLFIRRRAASARSRGSSRPRKACDPSSRRTNERPSRSRAPA
jgi:GH15 family glucan-1,4-alpha-glucosidase